MVAEPWILKMGNQVSSNLKHALLLQHSKKSNPKATPNNSNTKTQKQTIGILSFEVANVMSKTVYLHKSLTDSEISKLKVEILKSEGVQRLVSSDEAYLLELALAEKLEDLNRVAAVVARLGKRCVEPALQGFEHVYGDLVNGVIEVRELGFLVKDMEGMIRKLERYVNATSNLYGELEVLNELEQATKKFQNNQHEESKRAFEQKLIWQKQDVRHLKDISLWNQTYDKVVELLARTVCTIYATIRGVFGDSGLSKDHGGSIGGASPPPVSGQIDARRVSQEPLRRVLSKKKGFHSGPFEKAVVVKKGSSFKPQFDSRRGGELALFRAEDFNFPCGTSPGRLFMDCLVSSSVVDDDDVDSAGGYEERSSQTSSCGVANGGLRRDYPNHSGCFSRVQMVMQSNSGGMNGAPFGPKSRLMVYAPPSTVGGSALALHYANVIIVVEKLLRYPYLVGEEARDDLYHMLPTSLRLSLRTNLKSYVKNLAIYDAPLAHDWKETLDGILRWLAPLAHNMIRWQSERNFEQQQIVTRTHVLLLQTLYFADRKKTEAAICQLLVGLNYICRYEHQQNALLDCASSFDFEDCMEWQMQCGASFVD
ncbi:protein PSK SIMULATOR 1 [Rosa sericea]